MPKNGRKDKIMIMFEVLYNVRFFDEDELTTHEFQVMYLDFENARHEAIMISECLDCVGEVRVVDHRTGEIMCVCAQGRVAYATVECEGDD